MAKNKFKKLLQVFPEDQQDYVTDHPKLNTLEAISEVESGGGKYLKHKPISEGLHKGSSAVGKYGLMPLTIKETEKSLADLSDQQIKKKIAMNPELEDKIASKYYDRLREKLGTNDPETIGYGWLQGISGAKKALNEGKDISDHWHVKKIREAYDSPLELKQQIPEDTESVLEDEPSIGDRISDLATDFFEKIDPSLHRLQRIQEKEDAELKRKEDKEIEELAEKQRKRAEAARKRILERKD